MSTRLGELKGCPQCEGDFYRVATRGEHAVAQRCDCLATCPLCGGSNIVMREVNGRRTATRCECQTLDRRIHRFNEAMVPAKFAGVQIEDLEDADRSQKRLKYDLLKYRDSYQTGDKGYLLWGDPGVGKTHLLCGLVSYLTLERGIPCRFIDIMRLMFDLKEAYSQGRWDSDVIKPLLNVEVLVIDELGKGRNSDYELAILDQLISSRYNARRTIHCTSNYAPELAAPAGPIDPGYIPRSLSERVGDRIFSRLNEMCRLFQVKGKDYRILRRKG